MVPHPGGLLGVAGRFPPKYMGGVFAGQALGGIFASVTNVVMFTLGAEPVWGAFFCFLVAVLFLFSALVCYLAVAKTETRNRRSIGLNFFQSGFNQSS